MVLFLKKNIHLNRHVGCQISVAWLGWPGFCKRVVGGGGGSIESSRARTQLDIQRKQYLRLSSL